ncbi:Chemotaxis response regulator protein-glutamate methylesterase [Desulfamplus magnetovallimortis]|uniref:Protein-glutamate methylesterase/protein-glutamine glutaminase n=1 Tax=Desulfamplus magnetovallimortis TaxID=1246637 RepID=A0A1W1H5P8_9BACT|nr:chemotaxis response regulator protein-glutamate methylesterase [Desulfamplus magnetovallimortis]SLM27799.1 Chemotaxis response regulator protein-glutamate methylesterase [Desulfamplus magnetovallimortis]
MDKIKVLVVDDTIVYRKIVNDVLKNIPDVEVVGSATNGKTALSRIASLKPDLLTLDIEMPEMSGIEVLEHIRDNAIPTSAVMLSTLTQRGSEMTIKALELGAFDFISKPDQGTMAENMQKVSDALTPIINAFKRQKGFSKTFTTEKSIIKPVGQGRDSVSHALTSRKSVVTGTQNKTVSPIKKNKTVAVVRRHTPSSIIGIGISTGGPKALALMMPLLTPRLNVPIVVVQHMPPVFTQSLAKSLNAKCSLEVKEAENGEPLRPNTVFIAPGGTQMKIVAGPDGRTRHIKITDDPPENSCKPSADYLFRSIAEHYVGRATGVIMTGMGSDGSKGLEMMKKNGSIIIAQDKDSCTVYGMPKEPIESGIADIIVPLEKIAEEITNTVI